MIWERTIFSGSMLEHFLEGQLDQISSDIESLGEEQLQPSNLNDLLDRFERQYTIEPIELQEQLMSREERESITDVSKDSQRNIRDRSSPFIVPTGLTLVYIPFSGDTRLLDYTPQMYVIGGSLPKLGVVQTVGESQPSIVFGYNIPIDKLDTFKKEEFQQDLSTLRSFVSATHEQVIRYNEKIRDHASQLLKNRIERQSRISETFASLDIPLRTKPGSPDYKKIELKQKIVKPLPTPSSQPPEPGIDTNSYETILALIRHFGRSTESTPLTFARFKEEELRDLILAFLNGLFEGGATGESFRKTGKTDIRIEADNRAAFVGECKIWNGEKSASDAIDQLLRYQTWRDTKDALVFLNKSVAKFKEIQEKLPGIFRSHRLFRSELKSNQAGEWRFRMRSAEDPDREGTIHVFLFDLYTKPKS